MTNEEQLALLKKAIDNISKALDGFYNELPKYLRNEMLHPKKKPRGRLTHPESWSDDKIVDMVRNQ